MSDEFLENLDLLEINQNTDVGVLNFLNELSELLKEVSAEEKKETATETVVAAKKTACPDVVTVVGITTQPQASLVNINGTLPMEVSFNIVNVFCSAHLACKFDLSEVIHKLHLAKHFKDKCRCIMWHLRNPKSCAALYASGKIICTGARSLIDARLNIRKHARILQKLGYPVKFCDFKIHNAVARVCVPFRINIIDIVKEHKECGTYEGELFSGLYLRFPNTSVKVRIFESGICIFTGFVVVEKAIRSLEILMPILLKHKVVKQQ